MERPPWTLRDRVLWTLGEGGISRIALLRRLRVRLAELEREGRISRIELESTNGQPQQIITMKGRYPDEKLFWQ